VVTPCHRRTHHLRNDFEMTVAESSVFIAHQNHFCVTYVWAGKT
jgi:hypothetical protein